MKIIYKKDYEYNFEKFDIHIVLNSDTSLFTVSGYLKFCDKLLKYDDIDNLSVMKHITDIENEFKHDIDMRKFGNLFNTLTDNGFNKIIK
jgi:hypothetical protein